MRRLLDIDPLISPAQLRAARALLDWSRADFGTASGISPETIRNIETARFEPAAEGPVANSGTGRTIDCADRGFTLCESAEVRNRTRAAGSARIPSRHPRS
jgi:DNA-binding XRE family transcriptional regulator